MSNWSTDAMAKTWSSSHQVVIWLRNDNQLVNWLYGREVIINSSTNVMAEKWSSIRQLTMAEKRSSICQLMLCLKRERKIHQLMLWLRSDHQLINWCYSGITGWADCQHQHQSVVDLSENPPLWLFSKIYAWKLPCHIENCFTQHISKVMIF